VSVCLSVCLSARKLQKKTTELTKLDVTTNTISHRRRSGCFWGGSAWRARKAGYGRGVPSPAN